MTRLRLWVWRRRCRRLRCGLLRLGRWTHHGHARCDRWRVGSPARQRRLCLVGIGLTRQSILFRCAVKPTRQCVHRLHPRVAREGRRMPAAGRNRHDKPDHGDPDHGDHRQPSRPGAAGPAEQGSAGREAELQIARLQRVRHHGLSLREADTVRPLTESSTTGVLGTA